MYSEEKLPTVVKSLNKRTKNLLYPEPDCPARVYKVITYWNLCGNSHKHYDTRTAIYKRIISKIRRLYVGLSDIPKIDEELYKEYLNHRFTYEEFVLSIDNFRLSALDIRYNPSPGDYKNWLKGISFDTFLHKSSCLTINNKSLFLYFLTHEPVSTISVMNKYPEVSSSIMDIYMKEATGNLVQETMLSEKDTTCFYLAAEKVVEFFKDNRNKLSPYVCSSPHSALRAKEMAELLWKAVFSSIGEKNTIQITPAWLCSDKTFTLRLPQYLHNQNLLFDKNGIYNF